MEKWEDIEKKEELKNRVNIGGESTGELNEGEGEVVGVGEIMNKGNEKEIERENFLLSQEGIEFKNSNTKKKNRKLLFWNIAGLER